MKKPEIVQLLTPWGETLDEIPWNVYPRPQMKRDSFLCLNGTWKITIGHGEEQTIIVPFAPESVLSGLGCEVKNGEEMHYVKQFTLPETFLKDRVLLHFGAVDQTCHVYLNGNKVGIHEGGYDAFSFDITPYLAKENTLEVYVTDELITHTLPYGKQRFDRGGMWYTPVSGIWQTVWLESVPEFYVSNLRMDVTLTSCTIFAEGVETGTVTVKTEEGEQEFALTNGVCKIELDHPHLWTPEDPYLYHFTLKAGEDVVKSYFALRTLLAKVVNGVSRLCLNDKPYFFHGLLDQGYFSDGIYTPASPEAYEFDILSMKQLGFNMLRKHIKVEPEQFYYDCDRLGMVVFQDMVNNGHYSFFRDTALPTIGIQKLKDTNLHRDPATREAFAVGMERTVKQLYNHPSICYWTIFNEGWGQFTAQKMYKKMLTLDTSRFIDTTSGWFRCADSQVESLHIYFKPIKIKPCDKPIVLSEFGGYSYKVKGHSFNLSSTYGYRFFEEETPFRKAVVDLYMEQVLPTIKGGLCATVYTQVSDVEDETNGLLTYDRRVLKVDVDEMRAVASAIFDAFCEATK